MKKHQIKLAIDILMTICLLFLMGYQFWKEAAHEWVGFFLFFLFVMHHILNVHWYKSLIHGRYTWIRVILCVIDILLVADMIGLVTSSILLSEHVLFFLKFQGLISSARVLHMATAYWSYVLMALHIGLHWRMVLGLAHKHLHFAHHLESCLLFLIAMVIACIGLMQFLQQDLLTYMFVRTEFVFLDFSESVIQFYLDYLALMGFFIFIAYYLSKVLRFFSRGR